VLLASVVVTWPAARRPRAPEAGGVPRPAVLQPVSAEFRERFGSRQELVVAAGHDSNTSMYSPGLDAGRTGVLAVVAVMGHSRAVELANRPKPSIYVG
jgi:sugar (pentulose or hexulose) kinase